MNKDKEIEQILLNEDTCDSIIQKKKEKEFLKSLEKTDTKPAIITDIAKVPKDKLFSSKATFSLINKSSKTQSYINGIQAESYLVSLNDREKLLEGITDSFIYGNYYIKFYRLKA